MDDVESTECIYLENELGYGGYGSTGIGENCSDSGGQLIMTGAFNATGKWLTDFPITPDKVLKALGKA
jgi:CO/xanthine dehydrogenase Mo-binding subunit